MLCVLDVTLNRNVYEKRSSISCKNYVFTAVLLKIYVFWNVMPCQLVNSYRCSEPTRVTVYHNRRLFVPSFVMQRNSDQSPVL
jgi:hypothetical protein